ncbi:MAG: hypothetical protein ACI9KS_000798 [Sulfitobacter sp.]|jgi:hypothetical protein
MGDYLWHFAVLYGVLSVLKAGFQMALSLGAPLGHLTLGGQYQGALPMSVRLGASLQGLILMVLAGAVLNAGGVMELGLPSWTVWVAVGVMALSGLGTLVTPSRAERRLWLPVTLAMLGASVFVALG